MIIICESYLFYDNHVCISPPNAPLVLIVSQLIKPPHNRGHLIELITRILEGRHPRYVSGSGMTLATRNRIKIYNVIGGIKEFTFSSGEAHKMSLELESFISSEVLPATRISSILSTIGSTSYDCEEQSEKRIRIEDSSASEEDDMTYLLKMLIPKSFELDKEMSAFLIKLTPVLPSLLELLDQPMSSKDMNRALTAIATRIGVQPISRFNDEYLMIEACMILLFSSHPEKQHLKKTKEDFLLEFSDFATVAEAEQEALFLYRNMMAAALEVIPASNNSGHLLDIVTRIVEGKKVKHIPGSGMTKATRNRINIYNTVGGVSQTARVLGAGSKRLSPSLGAAHTLAWLASQCGHEACDETVPSQPSDRKVDDLEISDSSLLNNGPGIGVAELLLSVGTWNLPVDVVVKDEGMTSIFLYMTINHNRLLTCLATVYTQNRYSHLTKEWAA